MGKRTRKQTKKSVSPSLQDRKSESESVFPSVEVTQHERESIIPSVGVTQRQSECESVDKEDEGKIVTNKHATEVNIEVLLELMHANQQAQSQFQSNLSMNLEELNNELEFERSKRESLEVKMDHLTKMITELVQKQKQPDKRGVENVNMNANAPPFYPTQSSRYYPSQGAQIPQEGHLINRNQHERCNEVKVKPFNPTDIDWYNYKMYFQAMALQCNWTDQVKCTKLLGALPVSLTSVVSGLQAPFKYYDLVSSLDASQNMANAQEDAQIRLMNCVKETNESIASFSERVRQLTERAYPHYASGDKNTHAIQAFIQGMSMRSDIHFQLRIQVFKTLQEATTFALRVEQATKSIQSIERKTPFHVRRISEDNDDLELSTAEKLAKVIKDSTESMRKISETLSSEFQKTNNKPIRTPQNSPCYVCGELGHWRTECPNRQRFLSNQQHSGHMESSDLNSVGSSLRDKKDGQE
jgi:hypothetical protein